MQTAVHIKNINSERTIKNPNGKIRAEYICFHNNGHTMLDQTLILSKDEGKKWQAKMEIANFPEQEDPKAAAIKLADWMERMAAAIKEGDFDSVNFNEL